MFSYVSLEGRVPADHPLRAIRALAQLSPRFGVIFVHFDRPSIAPEKLLRALLQALYTIRVSGSSWSRSVVGYFENRSARSSLWRV